MIMAPKTPGIHPKSVKMVTMSTEPQPLSKTASGGNRIQSKARMMPIFTGTSFARLRVVLLTCVVAIARHSPFEFL